MNKVVFTLYAIAIFVLPSVALAENASAQVDPKVEIFFIRLLATVVGGTIVLLIGVLVRRELEVRRLNNLVAVLRHQIHTILDNENPLNLLVPVVADDFKPLAKYMNEDGFMAIVISASVAARYAEVSQALNNPGEKQDSSLVSKANNELNDLRDNLNNIIKTEGVLELEGSFIFTKQIVLHKVRSYPWERIKKDERKTGGVKNWRGQVFDL